MCLFFYIYNNNNYLRVVVKKNQKMCEYSNSEWDVFSTEAFSWNNFMLAASYDMTEVLVDNETGEVLCAAEWELPHVTVMMALRGIFFMLYLLCTYSQNVP